MKSILVIFLIPVITAMQNDSMVFDSCPQQNIEFVGQFWGASFEKSWQECGKIFKLSNDCEQ